MVIGNEFHEKTRRREFRSNFRVKSFASESGSDEEVYSPRLSGTTRKHRQLQRTKSFHRLINEMSSSTRKLEEETSILLRDLVSFYRIKLLQGNFLYHNFHSNNAIIVIQLEF